MLVKIVRKEKKKKKSKIIQAEITRIIGVAAEVSSNYPGCELKATLTVHRSRQTDRTLECFRLPSPPPPPRVRRGN